MNKPTKTNFRVYFWMNGWGSIVTEVAAFDVRDAISKVLDPIVQKYPNTEIVVTKVE